MALFEDCYLHTDTLPIIISRVARKDISAVDRLTVITTLTETRTTRSFAVSNFSKSVARGCLIRVNNSQDNLKRFFYT